MAIIASSPPSSLPSSSRLPLSSLSELKHLKNQIIGTPSAKCRLAKDRATMRMLVETTMETMAADDVRTETAQILGSLASLGGHADDAVVISALIEQDALRCCLSALSTTINVKKKRLRLALTRALSAISGNLSELVGPPQWGLGVFESQWLTGPAAQTLEWFFSPEAMDIWIPMLSGGEAGVVAGMIGTIVRTQPVRERLCAWRNADEREKKERRGWEATRPSTSGSYVIRTLLELTEKKETLGNALFALAALAKDNSAVATELPLQDIVNYAKARSGEIQLSGCLCATNILRTSPGPSLAADAILSVLMAIIASGTAHSAKAAFVLSQLLTDSAVYAQLAFEHGALRVLLTTLRRLTPPLPSLPSLPPLHSPTSSLFTGPEWESWLELELDQPKADIHLREAILLSLASISLFSIDIRRALAEEEGETQSTSSKDSSQLRASLASPSFHQSQSSLSLILAGLLSPHTSLRSAACHVVRALTRSVAVIRTNIVDSGLGWVVFATFMGWPQARPRTTLGASGSEEEDVRVVASALRAVCNAVCEFSPLSKIYVEHGLLFRLAEFIHPNHPFAEAASDADTEDSLRFNSLWAVKNLVRKSSPDRKRQIISVLGWHQPKISSHSESVPDYNEQRKRSRLDDLLSSPSSKISEQVFNILRNIAEDEDGIPIVFNELDIRHPSFSPSTPLNPLFPSSSSSSSSGFLLLSHLMPILTSSSSHTSSPHVSHTSYSSTQDVLIQAASLLANLVNSSDLRHHRMILNYPGMANALRRVLAEQGPEVRRPVIRAILEMVKADLGASYTSVGGVREVGQFKDEEGEEGMEMEMEIGNSEVIQEEDGEGDADVMEIGHETGRPVVDMVMNASHTGTEQTRTYSHSRNQGLTGARKILIDAGFVGTLHRIIDQHHHHSSLAHSHTHSHLHPHTSAVFPSGHGHVGSAAGVHNHAHVYAHGSFGSSSTFHHHHFGSLDNSGAGPARGGGGNVGSISIGGGIMGNSGREDHEDLETARMALDWLEHGDMYVIHRRSASRNAGARSSSVSTRDSSADVSDH